MWLKVLIFSLVYTVTAVRGYFFYGPESTRGLEKSMQDCICLEDDSPKVSAMLTTNVANLKRLVLYVYRDPQTGVTHLYAPKKEIQSHFPDPSVNIVDEVNENTSANIYDSLNANPNFIVQHVTKPKNMQSQNTIPLPSKWFNVGQNQTSNYAPAIGKKYFLLNHPESAKSDEKSIKTEKSKEKTNEAVIHFVRKYFRFPTQQSIRQDQITQNLNPIRQDQTTQNLNPINYVHNNFDEWFIQQMNQIQHTGKSLKYDKDVISLKYLIEKILFDNNLYITQDGVLINANGQMVDLDNLRLCPILIGNSFDVRNLLQDTTASKFILPSNLTYVEAVLLTSVNPPITLGAIIPIRKTYDPSTSFTYFNYTTESEKSPSIIRRAIFRNDFDNFKQDFNNLYGSQSNNVMYDDDEAWIQSAETLPGYSEKSSFSSPMKPNEFFFSDGRKSGREVGYRIIGGNAATGSGTPVSSRGRRSNLLQVN